MCFVATSSSVNAIARLHLQAHSYTALLGMHRHLAADSDEPATPSKPAVPGKARMFDSKPSGSDGLRRVHTLTLPT